MNNDEKHKESFDAAAWGDFARGFRESATELRDEISECALNRSEQILLGPACADLVISMPLAIVRITRLLIVIIGNRISSFVIAECFCSCYIFGITFC